MFRWKGNVKGLCGNYNGIGSDDLKSPGGIIESSPVLFGDTWKLHSYCPPAVIQQVRLKGLFMEFQATLHLREVCSIHNVCMINNDGKIFGFLAENWLLSIVGFSMKVKFKGYTCATNIPLFKIECHWKLRLHSL